MIKLKSTTLTVAAAATPESLYALTDSAIAKSTDIILKKVTGNAGEMFIGDATSQLFPIGDALTVSDFMSMRGEEEFDFTQVYIKAASNGDGLHLLTSERV